MLAPISTTLPSEKRMKTAHENTGLPSTTALLRTKTLSSIPSLVNLWASILISLGISSEMFTDMGTHANFNSLASVTLDGFAPSTLHRSLTCIPQFLNCWRVSDIQLQTISAATVLDGLQGSSKYSGMKGSTILKSLRWCQKQADIQTWSVVDSPLIQGWTRSTVPSDRRESFLLPLPVVVQWEWHLLQANVPLHEMIVIGGFLLMIWSGLRFTDFQRISIASVGCYAYEIRGTNWRTKTCTQGQPWGARAFDSLSVVSATRFSKFICAWDAFLAAQSHFDMDFVILHFQDGSVAQPYQPMSYPLTLQWFTLKTR